MKITPTTTFQQLESAERRQRETAILFFSAQTEAARELLAKAEAAQLCDLDFWREALDFAESEEARARREFSAWKERDRDSARRRFDFRRALVCATIRGLSDADRLAARTTRTRRPRLAPQK